MNVNAVAEYFDISRPAISKHVKILTECGLIHIQQIGRERHCEVHLNSLTEVADWIGQYSKFWDQQFDSLEQYLKKVQKKAKK